MKTSTLRRALIPCGGRGTRMLSLTHGAPKEMIPVAGTPLLERVAAECGASGIDELLVVISPGKEVIEDHLRPFAGKPGMPGRIEFAVQPEPRGLADAIRIGRAFARGEPLAVALPDNLFMAPVPALAQVIATHEERGTNVVAVVEISEIEAERRGPTPVLQGRLRGAEFMIEGIPDKGSKEGRFDTGGAERAFTAVGRYAFHYEVFDAIDRVERGLGAGAELDDIPLMQLLLGNGRLIGRHVQGRFLDVGLPSGHAEAEAILARTAS